MLRPKKHITRQKLKEDRFVTETMKAVNWLKKNQKLLMYGLAAFALIVVITWGALSAREAAEREASILTLQGGYALEANNLEQARVHLRQAVTEFGRVPSTGRATFMLGHVYFRLGQIDSARVFYSRFLDRFARDHLMRAAATAGLAACLEQEESWLAAADTYTEAARINSGHITSARWLLEAGRCYEQAGRSQAAIAAYEQLGREYPDSGEADRAAVLKAQLANGGL